jgi:spore coat protein CotH
MKHLFLSLLLPVFGFCGAITAQNPHSDTDFFADNAIQKINVKFDQPNWTFLLDSLRYNGDGLLLATVDVNGKEYTNVGVRYKDARNWEPDQPRNSFFIKLNYINKDQHIEGYSSIHLSNVLRDPSMIREVLASEIAGNYMPTPRANFANLSVNGDPYGLMVNIEPVEPQFLETYFGESSGALFCAHHYDQNIQYPSSCRSNVLGSLAYEDDVECYLYNYDMLSESGWDDLIELTRILEEEPEKIDRVLNVDRTLWMLALNNVMVNLNSYSGKYSQNFFLYRDQSGQFNPIMWDLNHAFGGYKNSGEGSDLTLEGMQELEPYLHLNSSIKPLISKLLENPFYKKVYISHLRTIVYDYLQNEKYVEMAETLQRMIRDEVGNDPNKFYSLEEFDQSLEKTIGKMSRIPGIFELMKKRRKFLIKHSALAVVPPDIRETNVLGRKRFSSEMVSEFKVQVFVEKYPKKVRIFFRLGKNGVYQEGILEDDGKHHDNQAGDGMYGITITPKRGETQLEYFIVAENAGTLSFDPPNYMWERHKITLGELNK